MSDLDTITEALVVRPGDTLIVRIDRNITADQAATFKAQLEGRLPGVAVLVVTADGMAVYSPDELSDGT